MVVGLGKRPESDSVRAAVGVLGGDALVQKEGEKELESRGEVRGFTLEAFLEGLCCCSALALLEAGIVSE
jgi:hypothetical protein